MVRRAPGAKRVARMEQTWLPPRSEHGELADKLGASGAMLRRAQARAEQFSRIPGTKTIRQTLEGQITISD